MREFFSDVYEAYCKFTCALAEELYDLMVFVFKCFIVLTLSLWAMPYSIIQRIKKNKGDIE